jgi:hypothetical protein
MADERGKPVEKYRLTKEQMAFQKKFKKLKQMQQLLEARSLGLAMQMENERDLWNNLQGEFQRLQPPNKSIHELPGMDFPEDQRQQTELGTVQGAQEAGRVAGPEVGPGAEPEAGPGAGPQQPPHALRY